MSVKNLQYAYKRKLVYHSDLQTQLKNNLIWNHADLRVVQKPQSLLQR